jgi:hypothetical protein
MVSVLLVLLVDSLSPPSELPYQEQKSVGYGFLAGWFTKKDERTMSSAFLSPIGERPIDLEEADEELNADQVHKEWKEYYELTILE